MRENHPSARVACWFASEGALPRKGGSGTPHVREVGKMRRLVVVWFAVLALVGLMAAPGQAAGPTFYFERSTFGISSWHQSSATEQVTTTVAFYTGDRAYPTPGPRVTLTYLSYWQEVSTWDGTAWAVTSQRYGMAHTDLGDVIDYTIGPGARSLTASATAALKECVPSGPACTPIGSVRLDATFVATAPPRRDGSTSRIGGGVAATSTSRLAASSPFKLRRARH